jgi:hypothetical protein
MAEDGSRLRNIRLMALIATAGLAWTGAAHAALQQLNCTLTDTTAQLGSENHPVVVTFDAAAKTLKAQDGDRSYSFRNVSISNVAISGDIEGASIGIDRSSLGLVWQHYGADQTIQFGRCQPPGAAPAAAKTH